MMSQLVEVTPTQSGNTWCNSKQIVAPGNSAGIQYPSVIHVSGYPAGATVSDVTVELEGATGPSGTSAFHLLVAPGGQNNLDFFDSAFAAIQPSSPVNLTIEDNAGQTPSGSVAPSTGSYEPYDDNRGGVNGDSFLFSTSPSVDSNIPQVPGTINRADPFGGTGITNFQQAFNNAPANGDWALYVYAGGGESETLNNGWCIDLNVNSGVGTTTALTSSQNPQITGQSVTLTASVEVQGTNSPVTSGGTVTFLDNGQVPAGVANNTVNLNGSGQAAITTSALVEGDHVITATYNGTASDNSSFTTMTQRMNDATQLYTSGAAIPHGSTCSATYCYCNPGAVSSNAANKGPFTPDPSNIFVSNLPGTISSVSLGLNQYSSLAGILYSLESMVVGPTGADLDFFSNAGGSEPHDVIGGTADLGNYIFSDAASAPIPDSVITLSPGTYQPSSYPEGDAANWPEPAQPYTASSSGFYTLPSTITYAGTQGSGTLSSQFANTNPNGVWSLYMTEDSPAGTASAANGWCVNLSVNPASVTVDESHSGSGTGGDFIQSETGAQITTVVTNSGNGPTGDPLGTSPLKVVDTLNSAFTYESFSGTGWSCSVTGQTVTCTNDSAVASGSSYPTLTLNVNVSSSAPSSIGNSASVSGAGITANSGSDTIAVEANSMLAVSKSHTGTFTAGSTGVWTLTISNTAASGSTSGIVNVSDTLPTGYTLASYTSTSSLWTCNSTTNVVTCAATPGIAGGSNSVITLTVNIPATSPTSVSNTALAWGGGDVVHTSPTTAAVSNNDTVTVGALPTITSGGSATFTTGTAGGLTVTTTGSPKPSLSKTGSLPSGVTFVDNGNGTGTLSGTPAAGTGGIYMITITASNGVGTNATQNFTLTIPAASATVTLTPASLSQSYAGSPIAAAATTTPTGLTVVFTYTGKGGTIYGPCSAPPTNADSYTVSVSITGGVYTGSTIGTLTIAPVPLTVSANNINMNTGAALPTFTASYSGFMGAGFADRIAGILHIRDQLQSGRHLPNHGNPGHAGRF
jgi:hypothetical protein